MKTIIDKSECKPLSDNIEGKLVVIKPGFSNQNLEKRSISLCLQLEVLVAMQVRWETQYL